VTAGVPGVASPSVSPWWRKTPDLRGAIVQTGESDEKSAACALY
jgi:hypothetical protein